jgi:hypothetical protein
MKFEKGGSACKLKGDTSAVCWNNGIIVKIVYLLISPPRQEDYFVDEKKEMQYNFAVKVAKVV